MQQRRFSITPLFTRHLTTLVNNQRAWIWWKKLYWVQPLLSFLDALQTKNSKLSTKMKLHINCAFKLSEIGFKVYLTFPKQLLKLNNIWLLSLYNTSTSISPSKFKIFWRLPILTTIWPNFSLIKWYKDYDVICDLLSQDHLSKDYRSWNRGFIVLG